VVHAANARIVGRLDASAARGFGTIRPGGPAMFESSTVLASLRNTWTRIVEVVPDLGMALILLVAGWLAARTRR
jgi:hypothetical protein